MKTYKPDEKDKEIIKILKKNSRYSSREIAKQLGLNHASVNNRIKRLIKYNIIQFTVKVKKETINFLYFFNSQKKIDDLKLKDYSFIYKTTGEYGFVMKKEYENINEFKFDNEKITSHKDITDVKTIMITN